jgi:alpha-mannosidase
MMVSPLPVSDRRKENIHNERPGRLYMIGNAHIDPVWLWRWPEGCQEVLATFRSALDRMEEYDDFVFVASSAAYYAWVEEQDPSMFAEIRERVRQGRWGLVGGWWVEPDCNLPGGESLVRQGLYGQRYFQAKFGRMAHVGYNVDSFGHSAMLPQILKGIGLDSYVFMRPSPHEKGLPSRLFWWEADDGSRVLAYRLPFEYCTWGDELEKHVARCAAEIRPPTEAQMCFYGVGNHGGGPTRGNLESIHRLAGNPDLPELVLATPEAFFERVINENLPVVHSDLQHHASGCYAAHSGVKRWNRKAEAVLLTAEKFGTLAALVSGTGDMPDLSQAWKDVLFNQFHDILAGTCLEEAYDDARDLYGEANTIAARALNRALQTLAWKIRLPVDEMTRPLVAFNPHAWTVRANLEVETAGLTEGEMVVDETGNPLPTQVVRSHAMAGGRSRVSFTADLPPMGYRVYQIAPAPRDAQPAPFSATDTSIENEYFRLELDPQTGWIKSLRDLRRGVEVFSGPAARPVVIDDPTDTWGHNLFAFINEIGSFTAERIALAGQGPVKSVLRVESAWGASRMTQEFSLSRGIDRVEVRCQVDWHEQHKMLKLRFPLHLNFMKATHEVPYGTIERFANGEEEAIQTWVDVSGISRDSGEPYGMSLLNDAKYSCDVAIRDIGLTVLRSPIYAHHMPVAIQPDQAYAYMDQGIQEFNYVLLPHAGSWETAGTARRAAELNQPPLVQAATFHPEGSLPQVDSFMAAEPENIIVTALKPAEDGQGVILRVWETARMNTHAAIHVPVCGRVIRADFRAGEIKTFRIPHAADLPVVETSLLEMDLP